MKKKEKILLRAEIWHAPVARQMISWNTASLCCLVAISGVLDLSVFNIWSIWFYTKFSLYTLLVKSLRTPQFFKNGTEVNAELPEVFFFFFLKWGYPKLKTMYISVIQKGVFQVTRNGLTIYSCSAAMEVDWAFKLVLLISTGVPIFFDYLQPHMSP